MDLNWLHSLLYGFVSGLADILPVSAQAHKVLLLKFCGVKGDMDLLNLLIHLAIVGALYYSCQTHFDSDEPGPGIGSGSQEKKKTPSGCA